MSFPLERPRRLRRTPALRRLVAEARVTVDDLVAPLFVREGIEEPVPISSLPDQFQHSVASLVVEVKRLASLGVPAVMLFGVPAHKDATGSQAWDPAGIVQRALAEVRSSVGDEVVLMADLCLDEYTDHGHCGVLLPDGTVDNDATIELYGRVAVAQAEAGAHVVAPSGMMDGQVGAIRAALDHSAHPETAILAYAAKYASGALRAVSRGGGRGHRRRRRPTLLPAGRGQPPGGPPRDSPRRLGGRGHGHGQARHHLPRRAG